MPAHRYVEEIGLEETILVAKRSAGVTPEVNLNERVSRTCLPSMNKGPFIPSVSVKVATTLR